MHAPLARHLVQFSRAPRAGASSVLPITAADAPEPTITMTVATYEERLEAATTAVRASLEADHATERMVLEATHTGALVAAATAAQARRDADEAGALAQQISTAFRELNDTLAVQIADALRPLLSAAATTRATSAVAELVDRVLAEPDHPPLTIRGPASRIAALEAVLGGDRAAYEVADGDEITVAANGIRFETRLCAALGALGVVGEG